MATWQLGPFDNDDAVEWCGELESTPPGQRAHLVHHTLNAAVLAGDALSPSGAAQAIAAAATVVQSLTGRSPSDSAYAPRFLLGRNDIQVTPSLRELGIRALDAVLSEGSPWRLQWVNDIEEEEAFGVVEELRIALVSVRS